jgi:hypothetical protein
MYNPNMPGWAQAIRNGNFDQASAEFQSGAQQVADAQIEKRLIAAQIQAIDSSNPLSKYIRESVVTRMGADQAAGKIQTGEDLISRYSQYSREESDNLNRDLKPQQNSEESAYFNSRKAQERRQKGME